MWRPPTSFIPPGAQGFSQAPAANQQHFHPRFQKEIQQATPMQGLITSPGGVAPLQHLGSPPGLRAPFNPALVWHSPPRGITQPSIAPVSNLSPSLQQPAPLISAGGMTSPLLQPCISSTLPSPARAPSSVLQSSPFNSPSWQVRNTQPSGFSLNQATSFIASSTPPPKRIPAPAQQLFASSPALSPRGSPSPIQQPSMAFAFSPPRGIPSSPVQDRFVSSTSPSPQKVVAPVHQPFIRPPVLSPRGVQVPQSSPFNSPMWQVRNPQPSLRPSVPASYPQPFMSPAPPLLRGMSSPRGVPHQRLQSPPFNSSAWQARNPQPRYSLNQELSIAAALDRHIHEQQWREATSNIQQSSSSVSSGPPHLWKGNIHNTNKFQSPGMQQFSPVKKRISDFSPDHRPLGNHKTHNLHRRTGSQRDGHRGREQGKRRSYIPGVGGRSSPRVPRCYSPPPPDVKRVITCVASEEFYSKKENNQDDISIAQGTEKLNELQNKFQKEIVHITPLVIDDNEESVGSRQSNPTETDINDIELPVDSEVNESPRKSWVRQKSDVSNSAEFLSDEGFNSDDDDSEIASKLSGSSSESDNSDDDDDDEDGDDDDDDGDDESGGFDDDDDNLPAGNEHEHKGPNVAETRKRKIQDPRRLHPELWFNEKGETNDGPVCRCSAPDKQHGIRHGIYPGENVIPTCDPLTNNADKLYHYWVTVMPHTNFMTENPTVIQFDGKDYTFEGFSMLSHHPLEHVPRCSVIRFNIEYTLHFINQPVPENFCVRDLDLFSEFLFYKMLELTDWDLNGNIQDSCQRFHFMPRFVHRCTNVNNSMPNHELLPVSHVLSHILDSAEPLVKSSDFALNADKWEEYSKSCVNSIVMNPDRKPVAIRVDDLQFYTDDKRLSKGKMYPYIVHHSIRPVQMSFAGDHKYQKLYKSYVKLRTLISNTPVPSRKNQDKLVKLKIELEKLRVTSAMRRDVVVEVSSKGMIKTGLKSDICQHALLLPVLVHHVRYHMCLRTLDEKMAYVFKDRSLLQLALTHPSYHLNFGMNPDHARNSLSNCGVKQPRYGDRKVRHLHTRKKGITQLIRVMSNLGKMEEHQSMIRHNERLEFLGDAVLELISSVHLYFMLPSKPEGGLAMYRSALVQNRHLAQLAKKLGLSDYMQYSHGPDLCMEEDMNHAMANCFEAVLGAMYLESGLTSATVLFTNVAFDEEEFREVWTNLPKHPLQAQQPDGDRHLIASSSILQKLEEFEKASGIEFNHIRLLARAFTHPHVGFNNLTLGSNQRMEFLGDSVLQFVVSVYLFKHFPEHHEGHLTLLRSSLVNHRIQASIARELGLDKLINFGKQGIKAFREKLLADILEAFVAALYVDKGLRYVETFCRVCLFPRLEDFIINQDWMDAKSQLQQCCLTSREQGKTPDLPQYKVLQNKGPAHHKRYTVAVYYKARRMGSGEGKSIQQAEMAAAKDALASHYFPELARQKRLLDRKHQGRRRNYWNKLPRREKEKEDQEEDAEFEPRWEENEAFEEDEDIDTKQDECQSQ